MSAAPVRILPLVARSVVEFGRMLWWLAPIAAVAVLAPETIDWAAGRAHLRGLPADVASAVVGLGVWALQLTAATSRALSSARGERPPLGETLRTAGRRLVPAALAASISTAAVLAGLAVLVAPGLVALAWLAVAPAAAVGEPGGPWRAMVRSLDLTRGHRGRVFAAIATLIAVAVAGIAASIGALEDVAPKVPPLAGMSGVNTLAQAFALTLLSSLPPIGAALAYEALRRAKEAPREVELARVFG